MLDLDVDLLDFGDVKLFMPKYDNLYNLYDHAMRGASPLDHYQALTKNGRTYPISCEALRQTRDPRYALYAYLQMLVDGGTPVDILDVGAFVGLIGVRCANLARCFGLDITVKMFDPSIGGQLIPYNIEINQLQDGSVEHIDRAISLINGPMLFSSTAGYYDGAHVTEFKRFAGHDTEMHGTARMSHAVLRKGRTLVKLLANPSKLRDAVRTRLVSATKTSNYLVRSTTFAEYFAAHPTNRHQVVKIDTEGMEPLLVRDLIDLALPRGFSAVIETTPRAYYELGVDLAEFLSTLAKSFDLFEFYHFPHPCRVRQVVSENIAAFAQEVANYPHGHTDLLIVPHALPNQNLLVKRLASFRNLPPSNNAVLGPAAW